MKTINKKTTIMTSLTIVTLLISGSSFLGEQNAYADPVTIALPGFESPILTDGQWTPNNAANPTEWTFTGSAGIFNPTAGQMASEANGEDNQSWSSGGSICQTLDSSITENTLYTLSVYVGARSDGSTYDDFLIELLDDDDLVLTSMANTDSSAVEPTSGNWALNTLVHLILPGDASIGKDLQICLSATTSQTEFDDVSLDATAKSCSSVDEEICKTIEIIHDDSNNPNGYIEPHEPISYITTIDVQNPTDFQWEDVKVQDNLGGDLTIGDAIPEENRLTSTDNLVCDVKLKGKTEKVQIRCDVAAGGILDPQGLETATLGFTAETDFNPGQGKKGAEGKLEYTSCGIHFANSGATVSGYDTDSQTTFEFSTEGIFVEVFTADKAGDCDGDTIIDSDEETNGTNPFARDTDGDGSDDNLDCEALDDTIHPGAEETLFDGVDQNCNGNDDEDVDGDTYTVDANDCNDADPAINPGEDDLTVDTVDQNCDGIDGIPT